MKPADLSASEKPIVHSVERLGERPAAANETLLTRVRSLLWGEHPECCGCPVAGAEYMGQTEMVCCGQPEQAFLNDAQIVASLRELVPECIVEAMVKCPNCGRENIPSDYDAESRMCIDCFPQSPVIGRSDNADGLIARPWPAAR